MSSPISEKRRTFLDRLLIKLHQHASHSKRVELLASVMRGVISAEFPFESALRGLDIGCGDMSISARLSDSRGGLAFDAIDIHVLPSHLKDDPIWRRYKIFDGENIPFDSRTFSFGMMCDVLHHVPESQRLGLMREALRTCDIVFVKDHFETGWWSRNILRLMDFVGNFGYGVSVPQRYFTRKALCELANNLDSKFIVLVESIDLYTHLPLISRICKPQWQFVGVIKKNKVE